MCANILRVSSKVGAAFLSFLPKKPLSGERIRRIACVKLKETHEIQKEIWRSKALFAPFIPLHKYLSLSLLPPPYIFCLHLSQMITLPSSTVFFFQLSLIVCLSLSLPFFLSLFTSHSDSRNRKSTS